MLYTTERFPVTYSSVENLLHNTGFVHLQKWSPDIYLSWACGYNILHSNSVSLCREASEDVSIRMKRRAQRGYGLEVSTDYQVFYCKASAQCYTIFFSVDNIIE